MKTILFYIGFISSCFLATSLFAQKGKMQPIDYNDKLAAITDSLYNMGIEWATEFQNIASTHKDYSKLSIPRKKIAAFASRKIEEVRRGPAIGKGSEELKSAMLGFLAFEKSMVDNAFAPLEKLNNASTEAEVEEAVNKLAEEAKKEAEALKKVNTAQEKYGELNGFTLEAQEEPQSE